MEEVFQRWGVIWEVAVGGRVLRTTAEHPFWVRGRGWTAARQLRVGDALRSHDGQWLAVEGVRDTGREEVVYNCRVAEYHTYFVGDEGWGFSVWAHNSCGPTDGLTRPTGYTRMQDYIPELSNPSSPATTQLNAQQVFALYENLQQVVNNSLPGYRQLIAAGRPRAEVLAGLQNQMNLLRWRFIDQVPGGRATIQAILREFPEITFPY